MRLFERFAGFVRSLTRAPDADPQGDEIWDDGRPFDLRHDAQVQADIAALDVRFKGIADALNAIVPAENRPGGRDFRAFVTAGRGFIGDVGLHIHVGLWTADEFTAAQYCHAPERGDVPFHKLVDPVTGIGHTKVGERLFEYDLYPDETNEKGDPMYVAILPRRDGDPEDTFHKDNGLPVPNRTYINLRGFDQEDVIYRGLFDTFELAERTNARIVGVDALKQALQSRLPVNDPVPVTSARPNRSSGIIPRP